MPLDARVLDLGTGTAQIPIELCLQNPRASVVAIDLAEPMLRLAAENVARRGLSARIALEQVDAKGLPFADGQFAAVMSNSIVHHIPEPRTALAEAVRVLRKPGGLIFVRDLARPVDDDQVRQLVETYAAGCNDHQRQLFDASLRAALSVEEIRALVDAAGLRSRERSSHERPALDLVRREAVKSRAVEQVDARRLASLSICDVAAFAALVLAHFHHRACGRPCRC